MRGKSLNVNRNITIKREPYEILQAMATKKGLSFVSLVRMILNEYLESEGK
jgi:hypothetical protein